MLPENKSEFEKSGLLPYVALGRTGKGKTYCFLDDGAPPMSIQPYMETPLGISANYKADHANGTTRIVHEVLPDARIVSLPYINGATTAQKVAAIDWIIANRPDYVVCSFHDRPSANFERLEATGICVCCAAGNQSDKEHVAYPARYPWTVSFGALEEYVDQLANYSNWGPELDCVCFTDIAIPTTTGTMKFNGTSAAAPYGGAELGLLEETLTGMEALQYIPMHCKDYYEPGFDIKSGWGLFVLPVPVPAKEEEPMEVVMKIGSKSYTVDGVTKTMLAAPKLDAGTTLVPLRATAEAFGLDAKWDPIKQTITMRG